MKKYKYVGLLHNIRVIKTEPVVVRFTLETIHEPIHCVVGQMALANKILLLENGKYNIAVTGHFNGRDQFMVQSMEVRNPDSFTKRMGI